MMKLCTVTESRMRCCVSLWWSGRISTCLLCDCDSTNPTLSLLSRSSLVLAPLCSTHLPLPSSDRLRHFKKKNSDKHSEFKKCFPNYFLYYCTVVQCEAHALYMYSTVLEDKTVVSEPCLRGKTQMQLIYFSEIRHFFTFLEYVKKWQRSYPPCEDFEFIILQIASGKTPLDLIRVMLVFFLRLQVSWKGYKPAKDRYILWLRQSYCRSIWKCGNLVHFRIYDKSASISWINPSMVLNKNYLYNVHWASDSYCMPIKSAFYICKPQINNTSLAVGIPADKWMTK